jgi:hypothetical protein
MDVGQIIGGIIGGAETGASGGPMGAIVGGVIGGAAVGTKIAATRYFFGKAISKGEDSFANLAIQCAVGEDQKAEFETTARFIFSTAVLGASAAGMVKGAPHGAKSGEPKGPGHPKTPKLSTTVHETELAGTGLKVKVPVKEHDEIPSVSRKVDGKGGISKAQKSEQSTIKERIQRTPQDVTNHFKFLEESGDWKHKVKDGKKIYTNTKTKEKRWPDLFHNEIECNKGNKSWVIDPVTGRVLDKKGHLLKAK